MSRGTASGQAGSKRPRARSGVVHRRLVDRAERVAQAVGQDVGQGQEHDRRGSAADSAGPRPPSPGGSRARCRLVPRAGRGSRRPGGRPGRSSDVVGEQRGDRDGRPDPADQRAPPPAAARPDEAAKNGRGEDRRSSAPSRPARTARPTTNWRGRRRSGGRSRPRSGDVGSATTSASARPPGRRIAPSARPTASIASPTATMCAWYQVVASWAAYQKTVPKAKKTVVTSRATAPDAKPAQHPPAERHVDSRRAT